MKRKQKDFLSNLKMAAARIASRKSRILVLGGRIESEFYFPPPYGIHSFWKRMVRRGERERESRYYHIHEASISKSMSWSDGASGQRGRSHNQRASRNVSVRASLGPEATTKPVRSHVSDHHSVLKQY